MKFLADFTPRTGTFLFLFHSCFKNTEKQKIKMKTMPLEKRPVHVCKARSYGNKEIIFMHIIIKQNINNETIFYVEGRYSIFFKKAKKKEKLFKNRPIIHVDWELETLKFDA